MSRILGSSILVLSLITTFFITPEEIKKDYFGFLVNSYENESTIIVQDSIDTDVSEKQKEPVIDSDLLHQLELSKLKIKDLEHKLAQQELLHDNVEVHGGVLLLCLSMFFAFVFWKEIRNILFNFFKPKSQAKEPLKIEKTTHLEAVSSAKTRSPNETVSTNNREQNVSPSVAEKQIEQVNANEGNNSLKTPTKEPQKVDKEPVSSVKDIPTSTEQKKLIKDDYEPSKREPDSSDSMIESFEEIENPLHQSFIQVPKY